MAICQADVRIQEQEAHECGVLEDNLRQQRWVYLMQPKKSMLKFRCPYPTSTAGQKHMTYFKGDILLQGTNKSFTHSLQFINYYIFYENPFFPLAFCSPTSTECRLIPLDSLELTSYDPVVYEQQLYYHNHNTRTQQFPQAVEGQGIDNSWDVQVEVMIICQFLLKFPQVPTY